ncbi:cytochrome b/b6 domain-containing protein [Thalassospiraceae bacterium LMO-JJ14]|nr:cytochrome b/b6 domain-containing protein [Thalassospiraceae bacterium LMO-JJ14]
MSEHTPEQIQGTENVGSTPVYVWDVPTRIFHWSLLAAVATSLISSEFGPMSVHLISGHVVLALLIFRLCWGFLGGRHARFASFVKGPVTVLKYACRLKSGETPAHLGHNPMGGWSVLAIITVLAVQATSGLYANDDILTEGPLADTVSKSTSDYLTYIHHLSSNAVYALIVLHLAAVAFYTFKGHGIIRAMIDGRTRDIPPTSADVPAARDARGSIIAALVIAAFAAAAAYAINVY